MSKTKAQILTGDIVAGRLPPTRFGSPKWYKKVRKMRFDPTIRLMRKMCVAPMLAADWTFMGDDEDLRDFIKVQLSIMKTHILRKSGYGVLDFGWMPFEKIFALDERQRTYLRRLKPLLHDITEIKVTDDGDFNGFQQEQITVPLESSFLVYNDEEGSDWYGTPDMASAEIPYDKQVLVEDTAMRFDTKVAGSTIVIHYPIGTSDFDGRKDVDNGEIARTLLDRIRASGTIALPRDERELMGDKAGDPSWKIEIISAGGGASFEGRISYYDALKARAFGWPERSLLEGKFGTKAEAATHGEFALLMIHTFHQDLAQFINWHIINQITRLNVGKENVVTLVVEPLSDEVFEYLKTVYTTLLTDPNERDDIDTRKMKEMLGVPAMEELVI